jgi:hypothetical protein
MSESTLAPVVGTADPTQSAVGGLVLRLGCTGAAGLSEALDALVRECGLSSAVVRRHDGGLAALAGDADLSVSCSYAAVDPGDVLVLPIPGPGGTIDAELLVTGASPDQAAAFSLATSAIGLALAGERHLEADAFLAAEQDRAELADLLHDGPVQQLVFARYAADAAVRGADPRGARDAVQGALVDLRRYLWHLRPRGADLPVALEQLSSRLAESGQRLLVLCAHPGSDGLQPAGAALAYRLIQSVVLSGDSTQAPLGVVLRRHDDGIVIVIDGTVPRLDRWRRRATALGGSLCPTPEGLRLALPLRTPSPFDLLDPKASS